MSNHLAIATVTATLQRLLQTQMPGGSDAVVGRPVASTNGPPKSGVNIFLYQVTANAGWRGADLPTRGAGGDVVQRPRIALDLNYLLSFHGDEAAFEPHLVAGKVVRFLHAQPLLTRKAIEATIVAEAALAKSNLHEEVERVKFTPLPLTLEELSKLWSVLLQVPYMLSLAYTATVVFIESEVSPRRALPVRERSIRVFPFRRPTVDRVVSAKGEGVPVEVGDTVVLEGSQLDGTISAVRVGAARLLPAAPASPDEIQVVLGDPALRAGVLGVQVVYSDGVVSNLAPLVLRPTITVDQGNVSATDVPISFVPDVDRDQPVVLFLNERAPAPNAVPSAYSFDAPAHNGITDPAVPSTNKITFAIHGVEAKTYLVRVHVGGAENVLQMGDVGGVDQYASPNVAVPS